MKDFLVVSACLFFFFTRQAYGEVVVFGNKKFDFQLRPRLVYVDVNANDKTDTVAFTNRTQLEFSSSKLFNKDWFYTAINWRAVNSFGNDDFTHSARQTTFETVEDSSQARIVKGFVTIGYNTDYSLTVGRSPITLDDGRFVDSGDWRQIGQQFDQVKLNLKFHELLDFKVIYLWGHLGVTHQYSPNYTNSLLFNIDSNISKLFNVELYTYLMSNYESKEVSDLQVYKGSNTYGLKLYGKYDLSQGNIDYYLEGALQKTPTLNYGFVSSDDLGKLDADFYRWGLGYSRSGFKVILDASYFSKSKIDDGRDGFNTPFGANHAYNGWSDVFDPILAGQGLNTFGFRDYGLSLEYDIKKQWNFYTKFFVFQSLTDFAANESGTDTTRDVGKEIDVQISYQFQKLPSLSTFIKSANYFAPKAETFPDGVYKIWFGVEFFPSFEMK